MHATRDHFTIDLNPHLVFHSLLFTGLLINRASLGSLQILTTLSYFHAAFEALAVNELRYLQLQEVRVSLNLHDTVLPLASPFFSIVHWHYEKGECVQFNYSVKLLFFFLLHSSRNYTYLPHSPN